MNKNTHCYIGVVPGCGCVGVVCVDDPAHAKDTANSVASMIREGMEAKRITLDEWRDVYCAEGGSSFGCVRKFKMRTCRKKGLNVEGAKAEEELSLMGND